jgi:signal transduction histidine kinase
MRFGREGITVHVDLPTDVPQVYGGADQLEQVFLNVQINAWHARPGGGTITVRAGTTHDGQVQLAFYDTGSGMSAAEAARAFEPLYILYVL